MRDELRHLGAHHKIFRRPLVPSGHSRLARRSIKRRVDLHRSQLLPVVPQIFSRLQIRGIKRSRPSRRGERRRPQQNALVPNLALYLLLGTVTHLWLHSKKRWPSLLRSFLCSQASTRKKNNAPHSSP